MSAIKTSDGYDIKLTIQSIKQYIGQVQKGIALYGTFTYDNQIFEIPYKNFNINSFCGKGTLTIPTNNGKLDIEDHKSITSLSFPICAPKTYLDDNFLFGCTNLFTLELAKPLDSVLYVGDNFMENCTNLLSLDITALTNVKEIGNNFLYSCSNLGYLDLTSFTNVEEIGNNFLSTCTNLKALRLPEYSNKTLALATSLKTNVASKE